MKMKLRSDKKNEIVCEKKERIVLSGEEDCMYSVRRRFHSVFRTADGAFASDMHKTGRSCSRIYGFTVLFIAFYRKNAWQNAELWYTYLDMWYASVNRVSMQILPWPPARAGQGHTDSRVNCRAAASVPPLLIALEAQFYKLVTL